MSKPKHVVVGLKTLELRGEVLRQAQDTGPSFLSTGLRPRKKRVFTEDEWRFLNSLPDEDLMARIGQGDRLIELLHRPEMLNMTQGLAAKVASNLRYQQDAIREIIKKRANGPKEID